jgi:hypothetical protein
MDLFQAGVLALLRRRRTVTTLPLTARAPSPTTGRRRAAGASGAAVGGALGAKATPRNASFVEAVIIAVAAPLTVLPAPVESVAFQTVPPPDAPPPPPEAYRVAVPPLTETAKPSTVRPVFPGRLMEPFATQEPLTRLYFSIDGVEDASATYNVSGPGPAPSVASANPLGEPLPSVLPGSTVSVWVPDVGSPEPTVPTPLKLPEEDEK